MDHSVNEELAGWQHKELWAMAYCPHGNRCQVVSPGIAAGADTIQHLGDMDSGSECTLSSFADKTKLCGAVGILEGRDAIQRNLDRPERWACVNLMKFNKGNYNVLHLGCGNPEHIYRLDGEVIESALQRKTVMVDSRDSSWSE